MITEQGIASALELIGDNLAVSAQCVIDGTPQNVPIHSKTIENGVLTIHVLLDNLVEGELTDYRLLDANSNVFMSMADDVQKTAKNLLLVTFRLTLSEVFTGVQ